MFCISIILLPILILDLPIYIQVLLSISFSIKTDTYNVLLIKMDLDRYLEFLYPLKTQSSGVQEINA